MKKTLIKFYNYFTKSELILWSISIFTIVISFIIFDRENYTTILASIIGATSLIFCAKGNPFGQILMIIFSLIYGLISLSFNYYGEMITYLLMTGPMAVISLISWIKHPYKGNKSEVAVNRINIKDTILMLIFTLIVTIGFYFILKAFNTANLIPSTLSVATSFIAVYLTFLRSPFFALAYAVNDIILIILWTMATITDITYLSVIICFIIFFINDIYGFISWLKMQTRQDAN